MLISGIPVISYAGNILLESCNAGHRPNWISLSGCNTTECVVFDNTFTRMNGEMVAHHNAKKLQMEVGIYMWGFRVSYTIPLQQFDACGTIKEGCPLEKGKKYTIYAEGIAHLPITGSKKLVETILHNETGQLMLCSKTTFKFAKEKKPTVK